MNEKVIIKRTIGHLIIRDILITLLIGSHIIYYFNFIPGIKNIVLLLAGTAGLLWIVLYLRLIITACKARKNNYLKEAFQDELFTGIRLKAGCNAFVSMAMTCLVLLLISAFIDILSINIDIPVYLACELIFLSGIATDDISKIILSRD